MIDFEEIRTKLIERMFHCQENYYMLNRKFNRSWLHEGIKSELVIMAKEYGLMGIAEAGNIKWKGRIDVIWVNNFFDIISAFEVDGLCSFNSIRKLNKSGSKYKAIVSKNRNPAKARSVGKLRIEGMPIFQITL